MTDKIKNIIIEDESEMNGEVEYNNLDERLQSSIDLSNYLIQENISSRLLKQQYFGYGNQGSDSSPTLTINTKSSYLYNIQNLKNIIIDNQDEHYEVKLKLHISNSTLNSIYESEWISDDILTLNVLNYPTAKYASLCIRNKTISTVIDINEVEDIEDIKIYFISNLDDENIKIDKLLEVLNKDKRPYFFNSVADMKRADLKEENMAITLGYYEANDGGGAEYRIVNDNTLIDDGGSIHNLSNGLKAVYIINNGSVNVRQFGAKGDYETDDTEAIQNALNYSKNVYVPKGIFMVQSIYVSDKQTLHGEFPTSRLQCIATNREDGDYMIYINPSSERVNISGLYLGGNGKLANKRVGCIRGIGDEHWNNSATITDCYITSFSGNAIYLDQNVHSYYLQNLRIVNMISGIYITSTDCNIIQTVIGNVSETGLFLGGDNFVSGVKCWECGKASDLEHKYYGIEINSNNTVIGYYGQQNHCDDIRINGDGNKIDFTSDMTGYSKTRSDVAIINLGENANYNQIKGLATQGKMHGFFDYLLYFDENQNQVGNTFEIVVYNYYQDFDIVVKNAAAVHNSNVIKIDNRDYGCKAENLIKNNTALYINYKNLTDVTSITQNTNGEFIYNYPISITELNQTQGCYMVYKMNDFDFTNKTKIYVSFDVDSNVETGHGQVWRCFAVKPETYASVYPSSSFADMRNKWHYDCVIDIPDVGLNSIRFGMYLNRELDSGYNYPSNTEIKIFNLDIRVV